MCQNNLAHTGRCSRAVFSHLRAEQMDKCHLFITCVFVSCHSSYCFAEVAPAGCFACCFLSIDPFQRLWQHFFLFFSVATIAMCELEYNFQLF